MSQPAAIRRTDAIRASTRARLFWPRLEADDVLVQALGGPCPFSMMDSKRICTGSTSTFADPDRSFSCTGRHWRSHPCRFKAPTVVDFASCSRDARQMRHYLSVPEAGISPARHEFSAGGCRRSLARGDGSQPSRNYCKFVFAGLGPDGDPEPAACPCRIAPWPEGTWDSPTFCRQSRPNRPAGKRPRFEVEGDLGGLALSPAARIESCGKAR